MTPEQHYVEAERLLLESEAVMREAPRAGDSPSYKDRRSARLLQLAKAHGLLATVSRETAARAAQLPDLGRPRRPLPAGFAPGRPVDVIAMADAYEQRQRARSAASRVDET